ncbi:hypothetical protein [Limnobacter parvus]|uniref:Cache domain-containing protein n=1 Tax=Limnobacter parvus TaxID=2939690 RepID=A0ABT1XJ78_9BURK|nr:hypothetical protein [Limnobacter parvus]MCR2747338.1 hypothetical protein [Limnobacter parvus]
MNQFQSFAKAGLASLLLTTGSIVFAASANDVLPEIKAIAAKPEVIAAVKAQNSQGLSMDAIKALDNKWIAAAGGLPEGKTMMATPVSKLLLTAEKAKPYFVESILTDNQGANVAISSMTSDYWQGDEPKFVNAYAEGKGADYVARAKKDESSGAVVSQVSVPVMDGGKAIGTLTIGVNIQALK